LKQWNNTSFKIQDDVTNKDYMTQIRSLVLPNESKRKKKKKGTRFHKVGSLQ